MDAHRPDAGLWRVPERVARKKLIEAARYFALGRREISEIVRQDIERVAADMVAFGFSEEAIAQMRSEAGRVEADDGLPIHPDNTTAVRLLLAMGTQWRTVALSTMERASIRRTGLDYGVLETTARLARLELDDFDFTRIRILEAEAVKAWAEDAKR